MPTPPLYRYYLINEVGYYYFVDQNQVKISSTAIPLEYAPVNWSETELIYGRDSKYIGVLRKLGLPLEFAKDGALILRKLYFKAGHQAYCKLLIEKRNDTNYLYSTMFEGLIDFTEISYREQTMTCKATELGLHEKIESRETTIFELNLDNEPKGEEILVDGMMLKASYQYLVPQTKDINGNPAFRSFKSAIWWDTIPLQEEAIFALGEAGATDSYGTITDEQVGMFKAGYNFTAVFDGRMDLTFSNWFNQPARLKIAIRRIAASGAVDDVYSTFTQVLAHGTAQSYSIAPTVNITFQPGDFLVPYMEPQDATGNPITTSIPGNIGQISVISQDWEFSLDCTFRMPATTNKGIRIIDFGQRLLDQLSDGTGTLVSSYLQSKTYIDYQVSPYNTWITSGHALRGLDPIVKTTWADFVQAMKAVYGLWMGIEGNVVYLEKPQFFMRNSYDLTTIERTKNHKIDTAKEFVFSQINVGYPDQDYDKINGRQEVCTEVQWVTKTEKINNTLDLISKYRADPFGIEYIRSRRFTEVADSSDNDVFLLHCAKNPVNGQRVLARGYTSVTGFEVANTTIFNTALFPKNNLLRNVNFIRSGLLDTAILYFQSSKKNANVTVVESGPTISQPTVVQNTNEDISNVFRVFKPNIHEFEGPLPSDLYSIMQTGNRYGKITFIDGLGNAFAGFPLDIRQKPALRNSNTIKLLAWANDNHAQL